MMNCRVVIICLLLVFGCSSKEESVHTVFGKETIDHDGIWLSHEHILVDFIGADSIVEEKYDLDVIEEFMLPYLSALDMYEVKYFVDATPQYLGRHEDFLLRIAKRSGLHILTNTGFYGARNNKFIPSGFQSKSAEEMASLWIDEFRNGINGTDIRPGFIKISIDDKVPLDTLHQKIVKAAALTHLKTGLTIASHTGKAIGLWPQLEILERMGVSPDNFIWVHAQNEKDMTNYTKAANKGCWISLDGIGWGWEAYVEKLLFAKQNDILHRVLISHDAGWYDPQKDIQEIQPFTAIFEQLLPALIEKGFTSADIHLLLSVNPAKAYQIDN